MRDALTDEIGASPPLPEKTEVTETVTAASPTLAKDVDEEKDEKKSNGKSTPSPGSDVDMEIVEDSRSATASTPTTNSKQPASKPVGGFFGGRSSNMSIPASAWLVDATIVTLA